MRTDGHEGASDMDCASAVQELILLISSLLMQSKPVEKSDIDERLFDDPDFRKLYDYIVDLRTLSRALNCGDLQMMVGGRGYVLANLKALQSHLRHLTWQTKKIADGDFSQKVDFLGEFSKSFNEMTVKLRDATENLIKTASLDPLTQIPNRSTLDRFAQQAFEKARSNSSNLVVLMIDIDHFKQVNDTYGHDAGDEVLRQFAGRIGAQFRTTDCFGRFGGEEFTAILPDISDETALKIGERCLEVLRGSKTRLSGGEEIAVTASIGISSIIDEDTGCDDIVKRADLALYDSKKGGRDRMCRR